jgi:hypothetical protein
LANVSTLAKSRSRRSAWRYKIYLAVDKAAVAKQTFLENGWKVTEEAALAQTLAQKPEAQI